jgi:hypothetical protein
VLVLDREVVVDDLAPVDLDADVDQASVEALVRDDPGRHTLVARSQQGDAIHEVTLYGRRLRLTRALSCLEAEKDGGEDEYERHHQ